MSDVLDLIVIGAGPGGYVAAIRAAQLGLKTALIERESKLGGTCLRIGCIPSKALLESTELLEKAQHEFADRGINVSGLDVDLQRMMSYKTTVVSQLDGGIHGLLRKNRVQSLVGQGRLLGNGQVEVRNNDATTVHTAKNI